MIVTRVVQAALVVNTLRAGGPGSVLQVGDDLFDDGVVAVVCLVDAA
jgi:hypothetical protein